jgi:hypothetical protein
MMNYGDMLRPSVAARADQPAMSPRRLRLRTVAVAFSLRALFFIALAMVYVLLFLD